MNTEKNINDYLHLYPRCECTYDTINKIGLLGVVTPKIIEWGLYGDSFSSVRKVILHLRPLSDMTDEESIELAEIFKYDIPDDDGVKEELINSYTRDKNGDKLNICNYMSVQAYLDGTKYLLSKHFDLFGLIDAGLAIDKTTLK